MLFNSYSALSIDSNSIPEQLWTLYRCCTQNIPFNILLCPLIPIPFRNNSGLSGHSRKKTPETADTSKTQNIPSYVMWVSPYSFHSFSAPFVGFTGRSAFLAGSGPALGGLWTLHSCKGGSGGLICHWVVGAGLWESSCDSFW